MSTKRHNTDVRHVIAHEGIEINVGRTSVHPTVINAIDDIMINIHDTDTHTVKQIGMYPCAAESYIYLYQIYNHEDYELHYFIVGDKTLYDENGYHAKIVYDTKLNANEPKTAFIEFAEYCEPLSY